MISRFIKPTKRNLAKATAVKRVLGKRCLLKRAQIVFDCEDCVVEYSRSCSSSGASD